MALLRLSRLMLVQYMYPVTTTFSLDKVWIYFFIINIEFDAIYTHTKVATLNNHSTNVICREITFRLHRSVD